MLKSLWRKIWVRVIVMLHVVGGLALVVLFFLIRNESRTAFEQASLKTPFEAVIVPGFPFKDSTWHEIMKTRVLWAKYLFDHGYTRNIIYSGSAVYSPYVESRIMKAYGKALGIPARHLFTEEDAEHSTENLYFSYHQAKQLGFNKVALATDPVQSYFLMLFAESEDIPVAALPIQYEILKDLTHRNPAIDPSAAFVDNFVPLPERESFLERFKGTLGRRIDSYIE